MITAAQAREKTLETITQVAKEFLINSVAPKIDEAVRFGNFKCTVKHTHAQVFRDKVMELLELEGYIVTAEDSWYDIMWEVSK